VGDRFIFIYGGQLERCNIEKEDAIYSLDTSMLHSTICSRSNSLELLTWREIPTTGESPPSAFRLGAYATVGPSAKKLFNFVPTFDNSHESRIVSIAFYVLNLGTTISPLVSAYD
jgi:hypothetical protein